MSPIAVNFSDHVDYPRETVGGFHCKRCVQEVPEGWDIGQWEDLEVGMTPHGVQVWCRRHNQNVITIDITSAAPLQTPHGGVVPQVHGLN